MEKRELVDFARQAHELSIRCACKALDISRTVYHYEHDATRNELVIEALQKLVSRYPRYGFGKLFPILLRQGNRWNH